MELSKENIEQIFINRGASSTEAKRAAQYADRFEDFYQAENEEAIKNLFDFLVKNIFDIKTTYWNRANRRMKAQPMLVACCFDLGIFSLEEDAIEALNLEGIIDIQTDEPDPIKIDLNKVLGLDVEAMLHSQTTDNVLEMVSGDEQKLARNNGLNITTVTWEDTSRHHNSCWGSNISDMTLGVEIKDEITGEEETKILPVIRANNFEDRSADVDPDQFMINVGNATGDETRKISLKEALEKPWELLSDPDNWPLKDEEDNNKGLFAEGTDKKALVSAQACMLPVTKKAGEATYKPYIYNYQSWHSEEHGPQPHVLTMMVTRQGISMAVCGKKREGGRGQAIWFNDNSERAPLVAKRPTVQEAQEIEQHKEEGRTAQDNADQHNRVLVIQVPLTPGHKRERPKIALATGDSFKEYAACSKIVSGPNYLTFFGQPSMKKSAGSRNMLRRRRSRGSSDLETAVIHTGETEGKYDENLSKDWTRDTASPIRITVQLAKATSNGVVTAEQMKELAEELDAVYENASRVGSLVTGD